jgi:hypothetical protein
LPFRGTTRSTESFFHGEPRVRDAVVVRRGEHDAKLGRPEQPVKSPRNKNEKSKSAYAGSKIFCALASIKATRLKFSDPADCFLGARLLQ